MKNALVAWLATCAMLCSSFVLAAPSADKHGAKPSQARRSQPTTRAAARAPSNPSAKPTARAASRPTSRPTSQPTAGSQQPDLIALPATRPTKTAGFSRVLSPWDVGLDPRWVAALVDKAWKADSDAMVILRDGKLVGDWYFGRPKGAIETMSMTKSLVALAIGKLLDEGKIKSLETPIHTFFPGWPQWKKPPRSKVTLKHILAHTSGLRTRRNTRKIYASQDFVKYALKGKLTSPPGEAFRYNNRAVNLLAGVVKRASGMRLDRYMQAKIFGPMGIKSKGWTLDKAGNPHAMSGAKLTALDLAKIGEMMRLGGSFRGKRILSEKWVKQMITPHPHKRRRSGRHSHGLLWWLLPAPYTEKVTQKLLISWQKAGMQADWLTKMQAMVGKTFHTPIGGYFKSRREYYKQVKQLLGPQYRAFLRFLRKHKLQRTVRTYGKQVGFHANGYLGQYLIVLPQAKLVIVRQIRWKPGLDRHKTGMRSLLRQLIRTKFLPAKAPKAEALLQKLYVLGKLGRTSDGRWAGMLPVKQGLRHSSPLVRDMAAWMVGQHKMPPTIAAAQEKLLLQSLKGETSQQVRERIWWALGQFGAKDTAAAAIEILKNPKSPLVHKQPAAEGLGYIAARRKDIQDQTLQLLTRLKAWSVKRRLAKGLAKAGPSLAPKLEAILNSSRDSRRRLAASILVKLKLPDKKMVRLCLKMLGARQWSVRRIGRQKLVEMGARAKAAIPFFREMAKRSRLHWQARIWKMSLYQLLQAVRRDNAEKARRAKRQAKRSAATSKPTSRPAPKK